MTLQIVVILIHFLGFTVDLTEKIAKRLNLKYRLELVGDNQFGRQDEQTGKWNGIMGELIDGVKRFFMYKKCIINMKIYFIHNYYRI